MGETKTNTFWRSIVSARYLRLVGFVAAMCLFVIFGFALAPVCDKPEDTFAAPVPSTTTLSMTTPSVSLSLALENGAETFAVSDPASFSVTTNNYTGYALSIRAKEDNANNSKLINGSHALNSISAATADGTGFSVGDWGYKPSKLNSVDNTDFLPAPTYAGSVLNATTTANSTADNYSLALAAKADLYTISGTYSNTFVLAAVPNAVNYTITYDKNTTDTVSNMPTTQSGELSDQDVVISNNNPTREEYSFAGWCNGTVTTSNGIASCSGSQYNPGSVFATSMQTTNTMALFAMWSRSFTINFDSNGGTGTMTAQTITGNSANIKANEFSRSGRAFNGWNTSSDGSGTAYAAGATFSVPASGASTTLYAQWRQLTFNEAFTSFGKSKLNGYYKMQDMTAPICESVLQNQETQLIDNRDNKVYWVLKAKDDKCWMTQNLDHNIVTTANFYTPANTDVKANWTAVRGTINATNGSISGFVNDNNTPYSVDVGNWYWTDTWYTSTAYNYLANGENTQFKKSAFPGNGTHGHVGNYYNWSAAVAMNDTSSYATSTYNDVSGNPQTSICPAGWRLPIASSSNTDNNDYLFLALYHGAYVTSGSERDRALTAAPLYFVRSGYIYQSSQQLAQAGSNGYYSTSTIYSNTQTLRVGLSSSATVGNKTQSRSFGSPVRCVAR